MTPETFMNQTLDPVFAAALRRELITLPQPKPIRTRRRIAVIAGSALGAVALGGVAAIAGLMPAGEVAAPPLAPPLIVNGIGPATVSVPAAPKGAAYLRVELACFDGTRCNTAGGGVEGPDDGVTKVQRDALPVTDNVDPTNVQALDRLDPVSGVAIDVTAGTHWRLYAVYTDGLNSTTAPMDDGRTLGIPGNTFPPDLVPAVGTNGKAGWVEYNLLTYGANPRLAVDGVQQAPIPVYDADGTTVIGEADVSKPRR